MKRGRQQGESEMRRNKVTIFIIVMYIYTVLDFSVFFCFCSECQSVDGNNLWGWRVVEHQLCNGKY